MSNPIAPAIHPNAIRLPEVENAVLDVLDDRVGESRQPIPFVDIDVAMDARGYSGKWVRRAVGALIGKGVLQPAGANAVQRVGTAQLGSRKRRRFRSSRTRRATLARI